MTDAPEYPVFAVTVDIVILTMRAQRLHVLLIERGEKPFKGRWALPGGFKKPKETLDDAAIRELAEETGVDAPPFLTQFGAYGDPKRDPRGNVVTVGYLAVLREVGDVRAGGDAADAEFVPLADVLAGTIPLAFDHSRILSDAVRRVQSDLETTGLATAFVGESFTLSELRRVFEEAWGVEFDPANFQRTVLMSKGPDFLVESDEPKSLPSEKGGRPSRRYVATGSWEEHGSPVRRPRPRQP